MDITLKLDNKDKTFTAGFISARMVRRTIAISRDINFDNISPEELDKLMDYIVELFGNQFTRDEPVSYTHLISEYRAAMHEGAVTTDPDGDTGIIVPQDIQTRINELMRTLNDLSQYIRVERVNTLSRCV